ncbi:MAG: DMT family transporter [Alphaproteobacteria bacterium]|nr:DMT family transporter [Alphaproteobacteria bacterium]
MLSVAAGVSVFSVQDVIVKMLSGVYPVHEIVVIRSLIALPVLVGVTLIEDGGKLRIHRGRLHVVRGLFLYIAYTAYYLGLASLPIADTVALTFTVPFFVAALAIPILGERADLRSWIAIGIGFLGVLVIARPGAGLLEPAMLLPLVSALTYAISALLARRLGATEGGGAMALMASAVYVVAGAVTALALAGARLDAPADTHRSVRFLLNPWLWPTTLDFGLLAACGIIAAFGFFFLGQGYRLAEANRAAPFEYVALPWGVLWGYLFFGNVPEISIFIGAAIIMSAGLYTLQRERRAGAPPGLLHKPS